MLQDIGAAIPRNVFLPPSITDVVSVLQAIDVAFHMNHRKNGQVMFDPATGRMLEGIGHYTSRIEGPRRIAVVCENSYPCAFDRGLVTAFAQRFAPNAKGVHDDSAPCRAKGANSCTNVVTW